MKLSNLASSWVQSATAQSRMAGVRYPEFIACWTFASAARAALSLAALLRCFSRSATASMGT